MESVSGVSSSGKEVVKMQEILFLGFVLLCREYDNGISFICSCIMGLFFFSLDLIKFINLVSGWVLCLEFEGVVCCSVYMRPATIFL